MLGKLKRVLSQSTHPVNETAEGVPCASGKKGEAGGSERVPEGCLPWNLGLSGARGSSF